LPRLRSFPHSGGARHPENLQRGTRLPSAWGWLLRALGAKAYWVAASGWELEALLAEPAAAEILAKVPAAERILRRLRRMLGMGPYNPDLRRQRHTPSRSRAAGSCSSSERSY
jgi:hypothetical protein